MSQGVRGAARALEIIMNKGRKTGTGLLAITIIGLVVVGLVGCMSQEEKLLERRILEYYQYDKARDWETTYNFRSPLFREVITKEDYMKEMTEEMKDWELVRVKVGGIRIKRDWAEIELDVKEYCHNHPVIGKGHQVSRGTSYWRKIDGTWYAIKVDSRSHLPINSNPVYEERPPGEKDVIYVLPPRED